MFPVGWDVVQPLPKAASAPLFTSFPALPALRAPQEFGNTLGYFLALMAHGKGIVFRQPLVGGLRPCIADHECSLLPAHSSAGVPGSQCRGQIPL